MILKSFKQISILCLSLLVIACNDNLEIVPSSSVIPENYLKEESQLDSYVINLYPSLPYLPPRSGA